MAIETMAFVMKGQLANSGGKDAAVQKKRREKDARGTKIKKGKGGGGSTRKRFL